MPLTLLFARTRAAIAGAAVALTALVVAAAPARPVAAGPPGAPRVTLMGDSTLMAMEYYPNDDELIATVYDVNLETGNCRRLVRPSCGPSGQVPTPSALPVMQTTGKGQLGQVLVMMAGYDDFHDITGDIDAIMAEATAQGVGEVMWMTFRESPTYFLPTGEVGSPIYAEHNALLRAAVGRWPNLTILDWNAYSLPHPEWFSSDGIHLRPSGSVQLATFIKAALDARPLTRCDARNTLTGTADAVEAATPATTAPGGFTGIAPVRRLDTRRADLGGAAGMLGAGRTVTIPLAGVVAPDATSAVLTITAVDPCATGYLTVFPCGPLPPTSNVNFVARRNTAALVVGALGPDDTVCVHASTATDVAVDVLGSFGAGGDGFHAIEPTRWIDTRGDAAAQLPAIVGALSPGSARSIAVAGTGTVAAGARAVMVNVTVAGSTADTAISLQPGPCGTAATTSTLNVGPGRDAAASAIVALGADGSLCATAFSGGGHLVVDVAGWFGPAAGGLRFAGSTPQRLLDTRQSAGAAVAAGSSRSVDIGAVSMLSVVMTDTTGAGWASVKPCGTTATSSLVNTVAGEPTANAAAVAPGANTAACITTSITAHFVVDRTGTFVP